MAKKLSAGKIRQKLTDARSSLRMIVFYEKSPSVNVPNTFSNDVYKMYQQLEKLRNKVN